MPPDDLSRLLATLAWICGNAAVILALMGCASRRTADWFLFGMVILTLALLANAGIVRLFI